MGVKFNELYNDPMFIEPVLKAKIDFKVSLIGKIIKSEDCKGTHPLETDASLEIDDILKILVPLGYTIDIVPIKQIL